MCWNMGVSPGLSEKEGAVMAIEIMTLIRKVTIG